MASQAEGGTAEMPKVNFALVGDSYDCKPLSRNEMFRRYRLRKSAGLTRQTWLWRAVDGHVDTLDTISDRHLLNLERWFTGRGELPSPRPEDMTPHLYVAERLALEEIHRRGLTIHQAAHPEARERLLRQMREEPDPSSEGGDWPYTLSDGERHGGF